MATKNDVEDLLGGDDKKSAPKKDAKAPAKSAPKKEAASADKKASPKKDEAKPTKVAGKKEEAPAKKPAPKADKAEAKEKPARAKREPVTFAEGEREALAKKIKLIVKKPINSKELAAKLEIETRKLRPVLYTMFGQGLIQLTSLGAPVLGMEVSPAAK